MCLRLACLGGGVDDDDYTPQSRPSHPPPRNGHYQQPAQRNGGQYNGNGGHYNGNGGYPAAHHVAAGAEADRKASNDVRKGPAHAAPAAKGWQGHAPAVAQDETSLKQAAAAWSNSKVAAGGAGDGARYYNYHEREHQQQPARREDATDFYYGNGTATGAAERY